jgi:hypothetical protein
VVNTVSDVPLTDTVAVLTGARGAAEAAEDEVAGLLLDVAGPVAVLDPQPARTMARPRAMTPPIIL